ncbi:aspartyl protease family protein [Fontivita pretiosa]|uniref:aspartyl protease family protein n=1 Tax=Fontivita pretiosa TaxID=2989684 RepID=UPI003D173322
MQRQTGAYPAGRELRRSGAWQLAAAAAIEFVVAGVSLASATAQTSSPWLGSSSAADTIGLWSLSSIQDIRFTRQPSAHALPVINSPPIEGFSPYVVFGLTNEQDPDGEFGFYGVASNFPGGSSLPIGGAPRYFAALLDSGSQVHYFRNADLDAMQFASSGLVGNATLTVGGVAGTEVADVTDALGVYVSGLGNATFSAGQINVNPLSLRGQWNVPVLAQRPGSQLPNIIGSPILPHYQVRMRNSLPRSLNTGTQTLRSPDIQLLAPNSSYDPAAYFKLSVDVLSVNGVTPDPFYLPSLRNFNNWADDPTTPGVWAGLFANARATHTAGQGDTQQFLFDTGADVTVLSRQTASQVGIFTSGPNPTPPDFIVTVTGAGGAVANVPGFYIQKLSIITEGDAFDFTNVPILVIDLPDPRDGVGFVPGVIGMNLFTDRDLIINGSTSDPYVAWTERWQWTNPAGGNWSTASNWNLALPNGLDTQANFLGAISSPRTVTVDGAGFTVGTMNFDNANRYTIAGPGRITMQVSVGSALIGVGSGSHTIAAPITLASDTIVHVAPAASRLTVSGDVVATGVTLTKRGLGMLEMTRVRSAGLNIEDGTVRILSNGSATGTSRVGTLMIEETAGTTARLDLGDNDLVVDNASLSVITASIKSGLENGGAFDWQGTGIISSRASADNATAGSFLYGLGVLRNDLSQVGGSGPIYTQFSGQSLAGNEVLVKYTYFGDADLSGSIDATDYSLIDNGYVNSLSGWINGDFDYSGVIDATDYALIDNAYVNQAGPLAAALIAEHARMFGGEYLSALNAIRAGVIPEPGAAAIGITVLMLAGRICPARGLRRRRPT